MKRHLRDRAGAILSAWGNSVDNETLKGLRLIILVVYAAVLCSETRAITEPCMGTRDGLLLR